MLRVVTFNYEVFFGATISETMEFMFIESFPPVIRDAVAMIDAVGTPEDCIWLPLVGTRDIKNLDRHGGLHYHYTLTGVFNDEQLKHYYIGRVSVSEEID